MLNPAIGTGTTTGQTAPGNLGVYNEYPTIQYFLINANITLTTSASIDADVEWYCWWLPFTPGSTLT